ncbi:MAG TPA: alpha/beta fold hydrolase [Nocardioidaceae bacterium]|nr:alpha/beta fold hydrolase [Nocardioidaceae bacterium]
MTHPKLEVLSRTPSQPTGRPPLLFVHGLGHGAWCWENWMDAAASAGYPAHAVSLRGHGDSEGSLRGSRMGHYVSDVIRTAAALPEPPVVVGHSMGGLVTQMVMARHPVRAGVLVSPVPAHPALGSLLSVARRHPVDALRIVAFMSLPLRPSYLFERLDPATADAYSDRMGPESPLAQYQLLLHRPQRKPVNGAPVLVLGTPEDRLVPIADVRRTARRYDAELEEFPGMGHDLMLDDGWEKPFGAIERWLSGQERA